MKRFMKNCLILMVIFVVIGAVLGIVGGSVAGRATIEQVVEDVTGGRVQFDLDSWEQLDAAVDEILDSEATKVYDIDDAAMFDKGREILNGDVDIYCPGDGIRNLEVEVGGCLFELKPSGDGHIYLEAENAHKFQGYVEDGTLYIRATNTSYIDWSGNSGFQVVLYVPEGYRFDEADFSMGAGKMRLAGLEAREASLEVGAGQIVLEGVQADELGISIGAGQISMKDMEVSCLEAEVGMGEFLVEGIINGSADIECSMGNVEILVDGRQEDFNYELTGSMGNIDLGGDSFKGLSQERTIDNRAGKNMDIDCSMGNITIEFRN